jgi:hypothetical protein
MGVGAMIAGWDDAPTVILHRDRSPKRVTFIYPYYCNPVFFAKQIEHWLAYPKAIRDNLSAIVVDDGSADGKKAEQVVIGYPLPFSIRLFYIDVDVRFNWIAARNIAMQYAPEGWCLGTDMDHMVPLKTAEALIWKRHSSECIYRLQRMEHTGERIHPHPNSWFMTRDMFWRFGGYDESFSGYYGTDGEARRRWVKTAPVRTLQEYLVRHECIGDSSTINYKRKQPEDLAVHRIIAARGKDWKPKVLSFPFHEVFYA